MKKCLECKHRSNKWCKFHRVSILTVDDCIAFKVKPEVTTNTIKKKSVKQEKRLAKDIGARRTPQSGAQDTSPTDMIAGNYIIESKATKGKSINVKEEWLSSLKYSPMHMGKIPTLILEFPECKRYVVIAEEDFKNIIKENKNGNTE